ncbi:cytochrome c oxidase subunit 8B isoform X1 [Rhinoraja longicauda]
MWSVRSPTARALRLLVPPLQQRVPAARIVSKVGKEQLTGMVRVAATPGCLLLQEQALGFTVIAATLLIPCSWILAHLEPHRRRTKAK